MADNKTLSAGTADGAVIATDEILGIDYQRIKLIHGADGVNDGDVSSANPLPVDLADSATRDLGIATVDGSVGIDAGTNLIGDVGLSGARTSGGTTLFSNQSAGSYVGTKTAVKASAGQLYWIHCMNLSAAVVYLQIFNVASGSVTLGTTVPDMQLPVLTPGDTNGAGFTFSVPNGIAFSTAITVAVTTAKTGATAATADTVFLHMGYA